MKMHDGSVSISSTKDIFYKALILDCTKLARFALYLNLYIILAIIKNFKYNFLAKIEITYL